MAAPITIQFVLPFLQMLTGVVFGMLLNLFDLFAAANTCGMAIIGLASTGRTHPARANAHLVVDSLQELSPTLIQQLIASASKKLL
jgi:hypothetical protein